MRSLSKAQLLFAILALDLLVKAAFLLLDATPRLFLGDSSSYLYTALTGWIPPDRSFVYGYLLRCLAVWPHSLLTVVWFQAFLSAVAAWLVAVCLIVFFRTGVKTALLCSVACAVEPLQLLSERFVLTEAFATLGFALFVFCSFWFLASGRVIALAAVQLCGVFLVSLRISFLPMVLFCSIALPFFLAASRHRGRQNDRHGLRRVVALSVFSLLLSQLLLLGYRHLYGQLIQGPEHGHPAYFYREGLFLLSDFAPLVVPADYPIAKERGEVFRPSKVPLRPLQNRDAQRWYPDGLCDRVIRECDGNEYAADKIARRTALHAAKRDPAGPIRLGWETLGLYFDWPYFVSTLHTDQGEDSSLASGQVKLYSERFGINFVDAAAQSRRSPSLTERWHVALAGWYWFLLVLPFLYLASFWFKPPASAAHWLCALFLLCFFEGAVVTVTRPTARFLTTMAWLAFVALGSRMSKNRTACVKEACAESSV